jgi:hypothetical protein
MLFSATPLRCCNNILRYLVVFLPYRATRATLTILTLLGLAQRKPRSNAKSRLCIAAGERGWEIIEYKELLASAREYLGEAHVHQLIVSRDKDYLAQVQHALDEWNPTHYYYDGRTGAQTWARGLWEAFRIAVMLHVRGVVPICMLTDLPIRLWRSQCAIVSAARGSVMTLMRPSDVAHLFPHRRLYGPTPMPFSTDTLGTIGHYPPAPTPQTTAVFVGSLYEPRTSILQYIQVELERRGLNLEIRGRAPGGARISDSEYWGRLKGAPVVLTTADQVIGPGIDPTPHPHLIYRYMEALACGSCLVAPAVPGIERFFTPGEHFAVFRSSDEAVQIIEQLLRDQSLRRRIAESGYLRAKALIEARIFWKLLDTSLGQDSLTPESCISF